MLTLPDAILRVLHPFATLFRTPTWLKAQILLSGAILAPSQRTVAAARRVRGRSDHLDYARYHEVLNRAVWSPHQAARILLMLLLQHLDQGDGPLVFGIDEILERRRGPKIKSLGIYRDAVRSSRSHLVKASGLRWVSLMWLGHVPWAGRYWALLFPTVLAPSERCYRQRGRRHKKLTDWARQMIVQLRRRPRTPPDLAGRQAEDWSLGIGHHPRGGGLPAGPARRRGPVEDRSRPLLVALRLPDMEPPAAVGQQLHVAPAECRRLGTPEQPVAQGGGQCDVHQALPPGNPGGLHASGPALAAAGEAGGGPDCRQGLGGQESRLPLRVAVARASPARTWLTPPWAVGSSNPAFRCTAPTGERCSRRVTTLSRCASASSVR